MRRINCMAVRLLSTIVLVALCLDSPQAWSQNQSVYHSEVDVALTVRSISILPVFDNLRGIYSRPIEAALIEKMKNSHHWDFLDSNYTGPITTPDDLEENPDSVKSICAGLPADAFVSTSISKGPSGVTIKMDLFLKSDQKLLAQESLNGLQRFDVEYLKHQSQDLLDKLMHHLPYGGVILSRQGTRVTVNLGRQDGVEADQLVSVIQIIKVTRHPKFNFLIGSEKEILGKVKLLKVDDTLSFGRIVTEKEAGSIQVNSKIAGLESVTYTNTDSLNDYHNGEDTLPERPDGQMTYGKNPTAWVPQKKPTFGMVGARFGIGRFSENVNSSPYSWDDSTPLFPSIYLDGELWLTSAWSAHAELRQGIITTGNPVSNGAPSHLNHRLSVYDFMFGYNLRLTSSVNAPKLELLAGYMSYDMYVDQSNPAGITSKTYSGPKLGLSGWYPIAADSPYSIGANLYFLVGTHLSESPTSSGSATNRASMFGVFADKQLSPNLRARLALDFEIYASDFSGGNTSSQELQTLSGGVYYLF